MEARCRHGRQTVIIVMAYHMAIDSIRLLTDSAAQIYRRLSTVRPLDSADGPFEHWLGDSRLDHAEEQALRRDYRRLSQIIDELASLVCSRPRALALIHEQAALASSSIIGRGVAAFENQG
jgi:hypothetical protein